MHLLIYGNRIDQEDIPFVDTLIKTATQQGFQLSFHTFVFDSLLEHKLIHPKSTVIDGHQDLLKNKVDIVITLGGDGTILHAITLVKDSGIPILGINLGRLGFLASTEKHKISDALTILKNKEYTIDQRSMLAVSSNLSLFKENNFALNDFTVHKRDNSAMITIHTYIDDEYLNAIWADGLIISTPTGSTGYSLSCGGPIVFPGSGNFIITPIAPHNLNVRPIVISDKKLIKLKLEGRADSFLCTLDSRHEIITAQHEITIQKCEFALCLINLPDVSFIKTVSDKLMWGLDKRNK
jgi:NAD+ kinase